MLRFLWTHWFRTKTPLPDPLVGGNVAFSPVELAEQTRIMDAALFQTAKNRNLLSKFESTNTCNKCGGLFDQSHLSSTLEATIIVGDDGRLISGSTIAPPPQFILNLYCQECKTDADISFKLKQENSQQVKDTKFFMLSGLYFRELGEAGEPLFPVTLDDYTHLFCDTCGEHITKTTKCVTCRKKKAE